ncbi:MAG: alkene reductase [Gammaproteobacteria bacterium]|nr:alkene reductase [Gammaproteobacteria bacterium]MBU1647713.1 alkene reductase [Gammaproteobacteria bacterium]MBU1971859.1 alkene reductase [Gammaproteobacteria bacterium]
MLFDKFTNGAVTFANRIVMAPMTRCRADHRDAVPNDLMVEYYRQRAGAGLIVSEGVPVSDRGRGYLGTGALWNEAQAAGWKKVTDAVHAAGGVIFAQLWHCGRIAHSALHADGSRPAGASWRPATSSSTWIIADGKPALVPCEPPEGLSTPEVKDIVQQFAHSAHMAKLAGFDGVEIHGANGYLMDQFRCPVLNDRADEYGGSLDKRYRLLLEIVDAVALVYEPRRIAVRQSPYGTFNDMEPDPDPLVTYPYLAAELDRRGIGFLHVFDQGGSWIHDPAHRLMPLLRAAYKGAIIACGGFKKDSGEAILARGHADLVAIGRPYVSNPDLVERLRNGKELARWDADTFYAGGAKGYTDYPTLAG